MENNSINLYKGNRVNNIHISSNSVFFNEPIVYTLENYCIYLRHATIDDIKNKVVPQLDKKTKYYNFFICIEDEEIKFKKYYFEHDSDEDCAIIYYGE